MTIMRPLALGASLFLASPLLAQEAATNEAATDQAATDGATAATGFDVEPLDQAAIAETLPLEEDTRAASITALQQTLYDLIELKHAAHQEHWNVVEIEFYQLHEFYEEVYTELDQHIDTTAERLRALGAAADGRPSAAAANAIFGEPDPVPTGSADSLNELIDDWSAESDALYDRMDAVEEDLPTQDLLIDITRTIDKQLWMIRAHLQPGQGQ